MLIEDKWQANITIYLKNLSEKSKKIAVKGELGGNILEFPAASIDAGSDLVMEKTFGFNSVKPWSAESPQLYLLKMQLFEDGINDAVDDYIERVGFREIKIEGSKLLINGNEVFLKGFNRHEDHPLVGAAFPLQLMIKDLDLILKNSVRIATGKWCSIILIIQVLLFGGF